MNTSARNPSPTYADRVARVRAEMASRKLDGFLVWNAADQFWLTGFTGEDGGVIVTQPAVVLLTDGRFAENADREAPWCKKVLRTLRGPDSVARELRKRRLARIGFEPAHLNVAMFTAMGKAIRPARLLAAAGIISAMRQVKNADEVAAIRRAIGVAEQAFRGVSDMIRPGVAERDIAARLVSEMTTFGAQEPSFGTIVASGPNGSLPHYRAGARRVEAGEGVLIDWGARVDGYVSDLTRMVWPTSIPKAWNKPLAAVKRAHDRSVEIIRGGVRASAVDSAARQVLNEADLGDRFTHALGHGIGLDIHEAPRLGRKSKDVLQPGMVVTVEPGVYLPGVGGIRLESDVLVTAGGCEVLSSLPM